MDKYYYLAAQLPLLKPDMDSPPSLRWFLDEARKWLSPRDYLKVASASIRHYEKPPYGSKTSLQYADFEKKLRRELAGYRKARKEDHEYRLQGFSQNLVKEGNPLEIEKKLILERWAYLDELEFGHYSDVDFLVITALKIQLLERLMSFDKEKGMEIFESVVSKTLSGENEPGQTLTDTNENDINN
ncbi:MAG: Uncharacterized protein XD77_1308 [Marinimicrobia bacterium 46_47]|nr:MAG: Uncharacterized protein XD77_1308 [Marinimicrobia bacterium 46_47]HBY17700.1 hypothetical protein [Candidatus Neomarinimicrobiota bacterium]